MFNFVSSYFDKKRNEIKINEAHIFSIFNDKKFNEGFMILLRKHYEYKDLLMSSLPSGAKKDEILIDLEELKSKSQKHYIDSCVGEWIVTK